MDDDYDADMLREAQESANNAELEELLIINPRSPLEQARNFITACIKYGTILRYWRGVFYRWDGCKYVAETKDGIDKRAYLFLDAVKVRTYDKDGVFTGLAPFHPNVQKVENFTRALKTVIGIADVDAPAWLASPSPQMPEPRDIIALRNGLYDVRCGTLYPHSPDFFNLGATDFAYDPLAGEPVVWRKFLSEAFPADQESIDTLQEIFGYLLTSDTSQQKIFVFPGQPRAGKGTVLRVLEGLSGSTNWTATTLTAFSKDFGKESLIGKQLAIIGDASVATKDALAAAEGLKSISGEDSVPIQRKYIGNWIGHLTTRFVIAANEMPGLPDASGALATRYLAVAFTQSFLGREDKTLSARLRCELPGIFNWAMIGLRRLNARGHFVQPATGQESINEAAIGGSHSIGFVTDCCEFDPDKTTRTTDLYVAYVAWCSRNNQQATSSAWFVKRIKAAYGTRLVPCKPLYDDGKQYPSYRGIYLISG